jgi:hypothetical protein
MLLSRAAAAAAAEARLWRHRGGGRRGDRLVATILAD